MNKFFTINSKKIIIFCMLSLGILSFGEERKELVPMIPLLPAIPINKGDSNVPIPLETKTIIMKMETEIVVPLEIVSDIDIQAMVIDDQEIVIPFEIEVNKTPSEEKRDYYKLNYSETEIDIDNDGVKDTFIYSSTPFINSKIKKDNRVTIKGKNISRDGYHEKIIYLEIDILD